MFTSAYLSFYGQSSCSNAINIQHKTDTVFNVNDSVLWLSFMADTSSIEIFSSPLSSNSIESISLFSNNCSQLLLVDNSNSEYMQTDGILTSNNYFIKVKFAHFISDSVSFKSKTKGCEINAFFNLSKHIVCVNDSIEFYNYSVAESVYPYSFYWDYDGAAQNDVFHNLYLNCSPTSVKHSFYKKFNVIGVHKVTLRMYLTNDTNNLLDSYYKYITVKDSVGSIKIKLPDKLNCDTLFYVSDSSYNIKNADNIGSPAGLQWKLYDLNTGFDYIFFSNPGNPPLNIYTTGQTPLKSGNYALTVSGMSYCGDIYTDSVNFTITANPKIIAPDIVCPGDTVMIIGRSNCAQFWDWSLGDGTTLSGNDTIYHVYNQIGNKLISLEVDSFSGKVYHQIHVTQPIKPIIKGNRSACNTIANYSIENYDSNYTYTWSTKVYNDLTSSYSTGNFSINGISNVVTADNISIDWNSASFPNLPNYVVVEVIANLDETNCSESNTHNVYECCDADLGLDKTIDWSDTIYKQKLNMLKYYGIINGIVTIKDSIFIDSSTIYFGPQAKLILDSNAYLEITNSTLERNWCEYMWDGIYTNSEANKIVIKNSTIQDAINGLVSENGGPIIAENNSFTDNYTSIKVLNHKKEFTPNPPPYNPIEFEATANDFIAQTLIPPFTGKRAFSGMVISNIEGIEIGDTISGGNYFENLRNGIRIYNSKAKVYNNSFKKIENLTTLAKIADEGAINVNSIAGTNVINNIADVEIGHNGAFTNNFDSCQYDIVSNNARIIVENNVFKNSTESILIYNFKNGTEVRKNKLKDVKYGIKVNNLLGDYKKLLIFDNMFEGINNNTYSSKLKGAISLINCNSQAVSSVQTKVQNNNIKFQGVKLGSSGIHYGIYLNNCSGVKVNSNHIARVGASFNQISNDWEKMIGIKTARSQLCQITDNYFLSMGTSIWVTGNCNLTQYSCNDLINQRYGFYFGANSKITEQGRKDLNDTSNSWNTLNKWSATMIPNEEKLATNSTGSNVNNISPPIDWYYGPSYANIYVPNDLSFSGFGINSEQNNSNKHFCFINQNGGGSSTGGGSPTGSGTNSATAQILEDEEISPEIRDYLFEDMMQGYDYIDLLNEFRAYDAEFIYNMLAEDTTLIWLGATEDNDYQDYFDSIQRTEIGDFRDIYKLISEGYIDEAIAANNQLNPEDEIFINLKVVLDIYLNSWAKERYVLTYEEFYTLYDIANQVAYEGGNGVYTARIMTNFDPEENELPYFAEQDNKKSEFILILQVICLQLNLKMMVS